MCKQVRNRTLLASSKLLLAKVFVELGLWKRAKGVLKDRGVIDVLSDEGEVAELGEAWLALAKCHVLAGGDAPARRAFFWGKGLKNLGEARLAFSRVGEREGDMECLFLEAIMRAGAEELGGMQEATACSVEWEKAMARWGDPVAAT